MASADFTGTGTAGTPQHLRKLRTDVPPASELAFPGCKPVRLPREALESCDGRLEFWDGATETAWVCEPNSPYHEKPGVRCRAWWSVASCPSRVVEAQTWTTEG